MEVYWPLGSGPLEITGEYLCYVYGEAANGRTSEGTEDALKTKLWM